MPPDERPIPRFIAEPPQEALPYGRWSETLASHFLEAAVRIETEEELGEPGDVVRFPERTWAGRAYVRPSPRWRVAPPAPRPRRPRTATSFSATSPTRASTRARRRRTSRRSPTGPT